MSATHGGSEQGPRHDPIIVVSGLPRSGTSMMMRMLADGGLDILTDGVRQADGSNLHGYLEFEPVKRLARGGSPDWLRDAGGRAVKVVSSLLPFLPDTYGYLVLFMRRPLAEIIASQDRMMTAMGQRLPPVAPGALTTELENHLRRIGRLLETRSCFRSLHIEYGAAVTDPRTTAERVRTFLGVNLDLDRMASAVDSRLYRSRG